MSFGKNMSNPEDINDAVKEALLKGKFERVVALYESLNRPLTTHEEADLGCSLAITSPLDWPRALALLQKAADKGHYAAARNIVYWTRDKTFPTHSAVLAEKYHRHATSLWQAPWKTFMAMTSSELGPLGFHKRGSLFWRRFKNFQIIEVRKLRWACGFDIRIGRCEISTPVPTHVEECRDNIMLSELVAKGEMAEYTCDTPILEVRQDDMRALIRTLMGKAIPWLEQEQSQPNPTSDGIRQPVDGSPKPSMWK